MSRRALALRALPLLLAACHDGKDSGGPPGESQGDSRPDSRPDTGPDNQRPPAPVVSIVEGEDGGLTCAAEAPLDPDGDAVRLSYSWEADSGFTSADAVIPPADAARGGVWTCAVTPSDALGPGPSGSASFTATGPVPGQYAFEPVMALAYGADLAALPDGTLLVATMLGELVHVEPGSAAELGRVAVAEPEDELLSLTVDPRFGDGAHDHVYTWTSQSCRLSRVTLDVSTMTVTEALDLASYGCSTDGGHSSGDLLFWSGETGLPTLYLAVGPVESLDPQDDTDNGEGLFAWDVDDPSGALVPALPATFSNTAQVANGLRNPWRLIDCGPALCVGDPGHASTEEIDLYTAPGMNFGAGEVEGLDPDGLYDDPIRSWDHDDPAFVEDDLDGGGELRFVKVPMLGVRVSAVAYSGRLSGVVLYGDFYDGWIRGFEVGDDGSVGSDVRIAHRRHVMAMAETPDGAVWAIELGGTLQRLVLRGDRPTVGQVGDALSETSFPEGGVAFDVRYPLWSNGAGKERMIQLPEGATIDVTDPDDWTFPVGTKLWKTFTVAGDNVETRLLEKTADGWVGGVYLWYGADAYLTDGTRQELILSDGGYTIPSTETCAFCHEATPGEEWPLGPEPFQLGEGGLLAMAPLLSGDPGPVPEVEGETEAEAVALRGALHGNCAYCHHDGGLANTISVTTIDLRYDAASTGLVGARVNYYHDLTPYGPATETLVVAGDPDESVLLDILEATDMPPVATWREDTELTTAVERWIVGL